jgi:hypothetical protein
MNSAAVWFGSTFNVYRRALECRIYACPIDFRVPMIHPPRPCSEGWAADESSGKFAAVLHRD